jgi:cobalt-zinc-cadmium efflux system membrane fusion protein
MNLYRIVIAGTATVLLGWTGCSREENKELGQVRESESTGETAHTIQLDAEAREQIGLETAEAQLRPLTRQLRTTGVVGPNETRVARVRALSSGVLTDVLVRKGDRVKAGQALLVYDNVELGEAEAEYRSTAAAIEKARSEAEVARLALERADRLVEIGGIAPAEQQRRGAEHAAASAGVRTYEAQLANLQQKLARFGASDEAMRELAAGAIVSLGARSTLRAPFSGVVLDVQAVAGETIAPERELATLADLSTVWIQGDLYERDLADIVEGRTARVYFDAFPGETFTGRVTYVSDFLDPATRTAKVRCEVKNPEGRLRLQMFAQVEIDTGDTKEALVVPRAALQELEGEASVFVQTRDDLFERRSVTLGASVEEWVEITAGLVLGEQVVTTGAVMLKSKLKLGEFAETEEDENE